MAYVVTENCKDCKYTLCAAVCPVEAFREGPDMLYIDPELCVNCDACMIECPVEAIYPDFDIPSALEEWVEVNRENSAKYPMINTVKEPLKGKNCRDRGHGY